MESFLFGCISGMFGVTISHPFDTIKTCIQTKTRLEFNPRFLYRGIQYPLIGVGLEKAIVFGTFTNVFKHTSSVSTDYYKIVISGACAGLAASLIVTPIERLKILWQIKENGKKYNLKEIVNIRSLFKGLSATFTRETPGFAIYFSVYEYIKKRFYNNNISHIGSFFAGGFSGLVAWIFIYPQDCIKTMIQSREKERMSFRKGFSMIFMQGGLSQFYRGFHFAIMRAIPLHAGTFFCFELLTKFYL